MKEQLTGVEARDRGVGELCEEIVPEGHRVLLALVPTTLEDLGAHLGQDGPVDDEGTPVWIYGSTLPRELLNRLTKTQVHEPFDEGETPDWFEDAFPQYIREATLPGYSCFSHRSLTEATTRMLDEYAGVRLKDPNGRSGFGQRTVTARDQIDRTLALIAEDVAADQGLGFEDYLSEYGYVVEVDVEDVEAWSVTVTRTPDGHYSSFGRQLELDVETADEGVIQYYGGTSLVMVRGDPEALADLPADGVVVDDPVNDEELRLAPSPSIVHAAQTYIEGMRLRETEGACETRANVDVVTGVLVRRDGSRDEIAAAVEESGRVGGASPAELLAILALRDDPAFPYAVRSTRHDFDDRARAYAKHAATVAGSRTWWDGVDDGWNGRYVFMGAF